MSTPHGQGGGGRASKPRTPVVPTNTVDRLTPTPMQQAHTTARTDAVTAVNPTQRPFINRRPTGQAPSGGSARQNMSPFSGENLAPSAPSAPSAMGKRGPGSVTDADASAISGARAAKRPANASTRSDLASGDGEVTQGRMYIGNMNEGAASSAAERLNSMSPGAVEVGAAGMSNAQAYVKNEQTSAHKTRLSTSENYMTAASPATSVTDGPYPRPRSESMDRSAHGGYLQTQNVSSPGVPAKACRACRSQRHETKDCHVPCSYGTVVICPFHNCSVHDRMDKLVHPLDGLKKYDPMSRLVTKPLYCPTTMEYKEAVWRNDMKKARNMLPELFQELVLNRRRKPCCRVVDRLVCPINITIQYSMKFCHGKMPWGLEGKWPYTMRDATDPAIVAKLKEYDELGWQGMPPGELEAKSWEQIKWEYGRGIIPAQVHSKDKPYYQSGTTMPTAAERYDPETHEHGPSTDVGAQAVHEEDDGQGSPGQEGAVQSQDPGQMAAVVQKLDALSEQVAAISAATSEAIAANSSAHTQQRGAISELTNAISGQADFISGQSHAISEQAAAVSSLREQVATLSEQVAANSGKTDAIFENKKDFLRNLGDFLHKMADSMP